MRKTTSEENEFCYDNKAQFQTLKPVTIYLTSPVFPHGQLHVTFNRSSSFDSVGVAVTEGRRQRIENDGLIISKVIYREVL